MALFHSNTLSYGRGARLSLFAPPAVWTIPEEKTKGTVKLGVGAGPDVLLQD
jgi:hypothetical protein